MITSAGDAAASAPPPIPLSSCLQEGTSPLQRPPCRCSPLPLSFIAWLKQHTRSSTHLRRLQTLKLRALVFTTITSSTCTSSGFASRMSLALPFSPLELHPLTCCQMTSRSDSRRLIYHLILFPEAR